MGTDHAPQSRHYLPAGAAGGEQSSRCYLPRAAAGVQPSEKGRTMAGQYSYDGWSCVRRMENNEPPLMQCYSNPKKARLTVEVCPTIADPARG